MKPASRSATRCALVMGLASLLPWSAAAAAPAAAAPLEAVREIDLDRYAGRWYEIARLYNRWQKQCASDVMVQYAVPSDGRLDVYNQCTEDDGDVRSVEGVARVAGARDSILEVRFAPAWLSFLPGVWGDYWVIDLAGDYSWAAVGEPSLEYFWILARQPQIDEAVLDGIVKRAERQGYRLSDRIRTRHSRVPGVGTGPSSQPKPGPE